MKFLDARFEGRNLMPIHCVSYDVFELGARDAIAFTFKDIDTGQQFVETIDKPKYEVYILKREYWEQQYFMDCWQEIEKLDKVTVSYHNRDQELAKYLGCNPSDVKYSPYIFGYDIKIEHFYWIQFLLEYGNDLPKPLNVGYFDIESDTIQTDGFAAPGEAPTCAITLIDDKKRDVYTFCLAKDNLPVLADNNPHYAEYEEIKANFYKQVKDFEEHIDEFIQTCKEMFTPSYGEFEYHIFMFDDEIKLHMTFWEIVRSLHLDIMEAWNAPYDVRNLIERPLALGYEPEAIICDKAFKYKLAFFEEDDNIQVHKRNHRCIISIIPLILCQMWKYAGVRSGQGKPESLRLNAIGQKELKDEKLNYDEEGNIKTFMYRNYRKFMLYNIKDVMLQVGIGRVTGDTDAVYDRAYDNGVLLPEAFVSTTVLSNALTKYFLQEGFVIGTNANRIMAPFDYRQFIPDIDASNIEAMQAQAFEDDPDDIEEEYLDEGAFDDEGGY